eukprot:Plantae.Rhodophyta-Hildenbrandia_rubra.ctg28130.p1 GENE.Plantae.Rhodophyta-Hildenbrandia_rubra.ctg28130~~Plantae.Rhodophyta-Hildenbrandia_rubra.ctg28130.p1  ORF type:complete len:454 (+),score=51.94 Plantae.Rhodophyta-Hildenbrandia_rubra.ctg28130:1610-2971(+)
MHFAAFYLFFLLLLRQPNQATTDEVSNRWFHRASCNPVLLPRNVTVERFKTYAVVSSESWVSSSGASVTTKGTSLESLIHQFTSNEISSISENPAQGSLSFLFGFRTPPELSPSNKHQSPYAVTRFHPQTSQRGFEFAAILHTLKYHGINGTTIKLNRGKYKSLIDVKPNAPPGSHVALTRIHEPNLKINITIASTGTTVRSEEAYVTPQSLYLWIKHYDQSYPNDKPFPKAATLRTLLCSKGYLKMATQPSPHRDPFVGFHYSKTTSKQWHKKVWRFHGYLFWSPWLRFRVDRFTVPLRTPILSKLTMEEEVLVKEWNVLSGHTSCSAMELVADFPKTLRGRDGVTMLYGIGMGLGAVPPLIENWIASLIAFVAAVVGLVIVGGIVYWYGRKFWIKRRKKGGMYSDSASPTRFVAKEQVDRILNDGMNAMPSLRLRPSAGVAPDSPLLQSHD